MKSHNTTLTKRKIGNRFAKTTLCFLILVFALSMFNCSEKEKKTSFSSDGMPLLDLSKYGKPFSIYVPDTISSKLTIEEKVNGALEIKVGNQFGISINEQLADIELKKQDIKEDEVNKFKAYLTETPNAILWESQITKPEYHFLCNQKVGNAEYSFEDVLSPESKNYSKEAIQKMFDSCNHIKEHAKAD